MATQKTNTGHDQDVCAGLDAEGAFYCLGAIAHSLKSDGDFKHPHISAIGAAQLKVILFMAEELILREFPEARDLLH